LGVGTRSWLSVDENLDLTQPIEILLNAHRQRPTDEDDEISSYLLFLVLCVFWNEECEALVNPTLLEELFKFVLKVEVEGLKLAAFRTQTRP
jgi:hypothetical protein